MASSDEREKVLRELFHSETYQKLEEKLKVHLKVYQDKYDLLLNKRKDLMQELQVEDHQEYLSKLKDFNNTLLASSSLIEDYVTDKVSI